MTVPRDAGSPRIVGRGPLAAGPGSLPPASAELTEVWVLASGLIAGCCCRTKIRTQSRERAGPIARQGHQDGHAHGRPEPRGGGGGPGNSDWTRSRPDSRFVRAAASLPAPHRHRSMGAARLGASLTRRRPSPTLYPWRRGTLDRGTLPSGESPALTSSSPSSRPPPPPRAPVAREHDRPECPWRAIGPARPRDCVRISSCNSTRPMSRSRGPHTSVNSAEAGRQTPGPARERALFQQFAATQHHGGTVMPPTQTLPRDGGELLHCNSAHAVFLPCRVTARAIGCCEFPSRAHASSMISCSRRGRETLDPDHREALRWSTCRSCPTPRGPLRQFLDGGAPRNRMPLRAPHAMAARTAEGIDSTSAQGLATTNSVIAR